MAETGKMQTYDDALDALLSKSVILPEQLLIEIEEFIKENKDLGYVTKEDFLRDVARQKLLGLKDNAQAHRNNDGKKTGLG
jgi:metal-responsive CopG/Arc/MetJ family transcriptional regulator